MNLNETLDVLADARRDLPASQEDGILVDWFGVPGTGNWTLGSPGGWYGPFSRFSRDMRVRGLVNINSEARPFWSTGLAGVPSFTARPPYVTFSNKAAWEFGGTVLGRYLASLDVNSRRAVVHSHGLYPYMHAVAEHKIECPILVSVGSPYREDMLDVVEAARPYIGYWLHISGGRSDWVAVGGGLFDSAFGVKRTHDLADKNTIIKGVGHSKVLREKDYFDMFVAAGATLALRATR